MQLCNATLHLAGDRNFAIPKKDVPVAEIVLWRLLHGQDAVVNISPTRMTTTSLREERERLLKAYGSKPDYIKLVDDMFRNVPVQGLTRFKHLGVAEAPEAPPSAATGVTAGDLPDEDGDGE